MIEDQIKLYKKAGGSIIDHKPVFSANSKILYVGCGPVLRLFSTDTGEHIQDIEFSAITFDKPEGSIVDVCLHPFDRNVVIVCFEEGRIISWSFEINSVISNISLNVDSCRVVRMKLYIVSEEYETLDIIAAKKMKSNDVQLSIFSYSTGSIKATIMKKFNFLMHSWSVSERGGKDFIAGIDYNALSIYNLKTGKLNKDITIGNERYFTCVACHPTEECVAAADNTGRIIVYYDFLEPNNKSPFHVYHWHTLAVNDVVFSQGGSIFYSGGNEHVLVKWTIDAPDVRYFLPRLPAPIVHATVASDNQYVAISTLDNGILIVDSQNKIKCSLQQFTWGFISVPGQKLFPSGLVVDPRSDCIVMNGKPGHIQFFSPQYSSLIYNMDVVGQNYVSQERTKHVRNAEVVAVNFSSDGIWLATSQWRDDPDFQSDTLLKFWLFDRKSQSYKLTSCITLQNIVSKILFQPLNEQESSEEGFDYFVATLCSDNKFRFWINDAKSRTGRPTPWNCHSIGYYKDYELKDICFSSDGSLLGAAFGPCLTLWDTETNTMKSSLTKGSKKLEQVVFGSGDCSFIAIASTDGALYAWNLLSLTLIWSIDLNVSFIVADPRSEFIATFTLENSVFIFKASSAEYVYRKDNLCEDDNDVLSATFFPAVHKVDFQNASSNSHWLCNSSLYFFTSSQELMAFEYQSKEGKFENLAVISEKPPVTPFQALVASQTSSDAQKQEIKSHLQLGASWSQTASQFIHSPAHAMPPVHLLSESLLKSLIITRNA